MAQTCDRPRVCSLSLQQLIVGKSGGLHREFESLWTSDAWNKIPSTEMYNMVAKHAMFPLQGLIHTRDKSLLLPTANIVTPVIQVLEACVFEGESLRSYPYH